MPTTPGHACSHPGRTVEVTGREALIRSGPVAVRLRASAPIAAEPAEWYPDIYVAEPTLRLVLPVDPGEGGLEAPARAGRCRARSPDAQGRRCPIRPWPGSHADDGGPFRLRPGAGRDRHRRAGRRARHAAAPDGADRPKILAPVGDRPFLDHLLAWLMGQGARRVVFSLGHLADQVEAHLAARRDDFPASSSRPWPSLSRSAPAARSPTAARRCAPTRCW